MKTLRQAASELGMDITNVRRFARKHNIPMEPYRGAETNNQLSSAFPDESFQMIKDIRQQLGFGDGNGIVLCNNPINEDGIFYFISLIPEFDRKRIKLGFTTDIRARLQSHRCSAPTLEVVETWSCKREWEGAAIAAITNIPGTKQIGAEVFEFTDPDVALDRANSFFSMFERQDTTEGEDE